MAGEDPHQSKTGEQGCPNPHQVENKRRLPRVRFPRAAKAPLCGAKPQERGYGAGSPGRRIVKQADGAVGHVNLGEQKIQTDQAC